MDYYSRDLALVHARGVPSVGDGDAEMTREQRGQRD